MAETEERQEVRVKSREEYIWGGEKIFAEKKGYKISKTPFGVFDKEK